MVSHQSAATESTPVHHTDGERRVEELVLWQLLVEKEAQEEEEEEEEKDGHGVLVRSWLSYCQYFS